VGTMAQPQMGASIEELARADRRSADLLRTCLEDAESVHLWAIGLDDQLVALSGDHVFIVKWGFAAGAPLGGKVVSLRFAEIVGADVRVGDTTGTFEIRAAGMPGAEAWTWGMRGRRSRVQELPNVVTISAAQEGVFKRVADDVRERVRATIGPPVWIPPAR
jgi:hypothetical protein